MMTMVEQDNYEVAYEERQLVMQAALAAWPMPVDTASISQLLERHGFHDDLTDASGLGGPGIVAVKNSLFDYSLSLGPELRSELDHAGQVQAATEATERILSAVGAQALAAIDASLLERVTPLLWLDVGRFGDVDYSHRPVPELPDGLRDTFSLEAWYNGSPYDNLGIRLRPLPGCKLWHIADIRFNFTPMMWVTLERDDTLSQVLMIAPANSRLPVELRLLPA